MDTILLIAIALWIIWWGFDQLGRTPLDDDVTQGLGDFSLGGWYWRAPRPQLPTDEEDDDDEEDVKHE